MADALADAKAALAHANKTFPSPAPKPAPVVKSPMPAPKAPSLGEELGAKTRNINEYVNAPKMHKGGPVLADGVYSMKAGEHVLTAAEADKARKHALMAVGMKSLAKPGKAKEKKS